MGPLYKIYPCPPFPPPTPRCFPHLPLSASLILRWRVCCRMTGRRLAAVQAPHLPDCCSSLSLPPQRPPTVLVQLSAHFRVCLKVCRCVSQSSNDGLLQRSLVWVTNGVETSLTALSNGFIPCHLSRCLSVPIDTPDGEHPLTFETVVPQKWGRNPLWLISI